MLPVLTLRLALVAAIGGVLVSLTVGAPWVLWCNMALAVVAIVDWLRAPKPERVDVQRNAPSVLTRGTAGDITWTVANPTRRRLRVALADELVDSLGAPTRRATVTVPAHGRARRRVTLRPTRRGRFELAELTVRVFGPWQLAARQRRVPRPDVITVYPPFYSRRDIELRLRDAQQLIHGERAVRLRGSGMDFDSLREYTVDDEVRRIDWAATARAQHAVVRTYRAERNQNVLVLVDAGRTMAALVGAKPGLHDDPPDATREPDDRHSPAMGNSPGAGGDHIAEQHDLDAEPTFASVGPIPRLEHAIDGAQGITRLATGLGDRVGMIAFSNRVLTVLSPRNQSDQLRRLTGRLALVDPQLVESDYRAAFATALSRFPRRAMMFVLTELANEAAVQTLLPALALVRRRHLVVVAAVRDPIVDQWRTGPVDTVEQAYRRAAAIRTLDRRADTARQLRAAGATVVDALPGELATRLADVYLDVKASGRL